MTIILRPTDHSVLASQRTLPGNPNDWIYTESVLGDAGALFWHYFKHRLTGRYIHKSAGDTRTKEAS